VDNIQCYPDRNFIEGLYEIYFGGSKMKIIIDWLKKNYKYVIFVIIVLFAVIWISIREAVIKKQTRKIDNLEFNNFTLNQERDVLKLKISKLQNDYTEIQWLNDSMKFILVSKQKELQELKAKHKSQIAELLKVPNDTIYVRLQPLYPNYDNTPLQYPFSGTQIRQIYHTAISFPLLNTEYELQGKSLGDCINLNTGYESGIVNLNSQVLTLQENIDKADQQVVNYIKEVDILKKRISRKGFWNKTLFVTSVVATGIAIFK
jgi:hypothetical protein